jgi:serine/threonine protein kinase/Tfp pilus assembly protein PilF
VVDILIGSTISHYTILEHLGGGGMGVVYKAEDIKLKRIVALKFLPPDLTRDPDAKKRFIIEAQSASSLDHANICNIHEIGETKDCQLFICMAYYRGETLKKKIDRGKLNFDEAIKIGIQILKGLAIAHETGIIHRDIKPANIIVPNRGEVKILDFGLAKLIDSSGLTRAGETLGSALYMSPEQIRGDAVDCRSDIWSFGIVMYEMLGGIHPFDGEHDQSIFMSILHDKPEPMRKLIKTTPCNLEQIVAKTLEKNVDKRYQKTESVLKDLIAVQDKLKAEKTMSTVKNDATANTEKSRYKITRIMALFFIILLIAFLIYHNAVKKTSAEKSIAVLPLKNLSERIENEYFCDGITEEVINQLSKISQLKVISRSSVMRYKNSEKRFKDIGEELGVSWILEGSVRRTDNQVHLVAQLVDTDRDRAVWREIYHKELNNVFAIQSNVAHKISGTLKAKMSDVERERIKKSATDDLVAYDYFLKGRFNLSKRLPDSLKKAIQFFEQAIRIDSEFALAYTSLAEAYAYLGNFNILPPKEAYPKVKSAAEKALKIDNKLSKAHACLGLSKMYYEWDWKLAENEFEQAIELNSNQALTYNWYALFLSVMGRFKEAKEMRQQAIDLDPYSVVINADVGLQMYLEENFDEAIIQYQKILKTDPLFIASYIPLGIAYLHKAKFEEAIEVFQMASMFTTGHPVTVAAVGYAYGLSGRREDAQMVIELLEDQARKQYVPPYWIAVCYLGIGDIDQATSWLNTAYDTKDSYLVFLKVEPTFKNYRSDPKIQSILKKLALSN